VVAGVLVYHGQVNPTGDMVQPCRQVLEDGNVLGTVIASYFLGLAETFIITFFGYFLPRDSIAFILMILVLIFLPSGVMGRRQAGQ
jgi:hypothetical protein